MSPVPSFLDVPCSYKSRKNVLRGRYNKLKEIIRFSDHLSDMVGAVNDSIGFWYNRQGCNVQFPQRQITNIQMKLALTLWLKTSFTGRKGDWLRLKAKNKKTKSHLSNCLLFYNNECPSNYLEEMGCFVFILDSRLYGASKGSGVMCDKGRAVHGAPAQPCGQRWLQEWHLYSSGLYLACNLQVTGKSIIDTRVQITFICKKSGFLFCYLFVGNVSAGFIASNAVQPEDSLF